MRLGTSRRNFGWQIVVISTLRSAVTQQLPIPYPIDLWQVVMHMFLEKLHAAYGIQGGKKDLVLQILGLCALLIDFFF